MQVLELSRHGRIAFMQRLRNSDLGGNDVWRAIMIDFEGITAPPPQHGVIILKDRDRRVYSHKCVKKLLICGASCKCNVNTLKL